MAGKKFFDFVADAALIKDFLTKNVEFGRSFFWNQVERSWSLVGSGREVVGG